MNAQSGTNQLEGTSLFANQKIYENIYNWPNKHRVYMDRPCKQNKEDTTKSNKELRIKKYFYYFHILL